MPTFQRDILSPSSMSLHSAKTQNNIKINVASSNASLQKGAHSKILTPLPSKYNINIQYSVYIEASCCGIFKIKIFHKHHFCCVDGVYEIFLSSTQVFTTSLMYNFGYWRQAILSTEGVSMFLQTV
jgi:hypothetical protein